MMKTVPKEWKIEKLGNLGKVLTGKTPSKKVPEFWDSQDIPFYKPDDFSKSSITDLYDGKDYISNSAFIKAVKAPNNSVLTTCIGIIGKVAITKKECSFNQQINAVVPDKRINHKFLAYSIIRLKEILQQQANAAVVPMINKSEFSKTPIIYPPLPQQEKIVSVLDTASQLVEKQKALIEKYDLFLKSKFIEMFGDPVLNPMGWEYKKLEDVADILTGNAFKSKQFQDAKTGIALCRGINVGVGRINWSDRVDWNTEDAEKLTRYSLMAGDIVLALDRPWIKEGFKIAFVKSSDVPSLLVQRVARIRAVKNSKYLLYFLLSSFAFENHSITTETTIPHISPKELKSFPVIQPSEELMQTFDAIAKHIEELILKEKQKLEKLQILYDALMQRACKGEIQ